MDINLKDVEQIVRTVLASMQTQTQAAPAAARRAAPGVFAELDDAVAEASLAQKGIRTLAVRTRVIEAIRKVCEEHARELAELAVAETGMGRVEDKTAKNISQARHTPGVECLSPMVLTGDRGLTLIDLEPKDSLAGAAAYTRSVRILGIGRGGKAREEQLEIRSLNNARAARARKGKAADLGFKPHGIVRVE